MILTLLVLFFSLLLKYHPLSFSNFSTIALVHGMIHAGFGDGEGSSNIEEITRSYLHYTGHAILFIPGLLIGLFTHENHKISLLG